MVSCLKRSDRALLERWSAWEEIQTKKATSSQRSLTCSENAAGSGTQISPLLLQTGMLQIEKCTDRKMLSQQLKKALKETHFGGVSLLLNQTQTNKNPEAPQNLRKISVSRAWPVAVELSSAIPKCISNLAGNQCSFQEVHLSREIAALP